MLETKRRSTRSHFVENSLWKRLWTCRKTHYAMKAYRHGWRQNSTHSYHQQDMEMSSQTYTPTALFSGKCSPVPIEYDAGFVALLTKNTHTLEHTHSFGIESPILRT